LALCIRSEKPNGLSVRVIDVIKDGADQCTRQRPGVVWLHFIGAAEARLVGDSEARARVDFAEDVGVGIVRVARAVEEIRAPSSPVSVARCSHLPMISPANRSAAFSSLAEVI
jgi:hypothetical protein